MKNETHKWYHTHCSQRIWVNKTDFSIWQHIIKINWSNIVFIERSNDITVDQMVVHAKINFEWNDLSWAYDFDSDQAVTIRHLSGKHCFNALFSSFFFNKQTGEMSLSNFILNEMRNQFHSKRMILEFMKTTQV